jgi:hypothetical protein
MKSPMTTLDIIIIALLPSMVTVAVLVNREYRRGKMKNGEVVEIAKNTASVALLALSIALIGIIYILIYGTLP